MKHEISRAIALLAFLSFGCGDTPTEAPTNTPPPVEPPPPDSPPNPPPNPQGPPPVVSSVGRIAFVSTRDGEPYIYLIDPDGSDLRRLVRGEAPEWSPDGRAIAFHVPDHVRSEVRVIEADGSNERLLAGDGAQNPTWSSDGRRIAFDRFGDVHVVDADGTGERLLVGLDSLRAWTGWGASPDVYAWLSRPAFSPDGQYVAVVAQEGWDAEKILIARADGSARLPESPLLDGFTADWSLDGTQIIASRRNHFIASFRADGSGDHVHGFRGVGPDWSADATNVVYSYPPVGSCGERCPARIWVADPTNDYRKQLVPDAVDPAQADYWDYDPAWSPGDP